LSDLTGAFQPAGIDCMWPEIGPKQMDLTVIREMLANTL